MNNITDFGLFVSIESSDLIGMIHFKDLAWNENDQNLKKFKKNESLKAKILEIDKVSRDFAKKISEKFYV